MYMQMNVYLLLASVLGLSRDFFFLVHVRDFSHYYQSFLAMHVAYFVSQRKEIRLLHRASLLVRTNREGKVRLYFCE